MIFNILEYLVGYPPIYNLMMSISTPKKINQLFVNEYIRPHTGDRILDIGCGTATILDFLPDVRYIGFDMEHRYINYAMKKYGPRGQFFCKKVTSDAITDNQKFEIILAKGVLHHLDDNEATQLFILSSKLLKENGRLITLDGCYTSEQSWLARYPLIKDRGKFVRTREQYVNLAQTVFSNVEVHLRDDFSSLRTTQIIMECKS
jgi:2-polyprenyl-3-methyl-5-hydroxy-6-metoxy-1,4-benzoquinol methylase